MCVCVSMCTLLRSGTEEEYAELRQFLEDILVYQRDFAAIKAEKHRSAVQTRDADKQQKEGETHKAAMEGIPGMTIAAIFYTYILSPTLHSHFLFNCSKAVIFIIHH